VEKLVQIMVVRQNMTTDNDRKKRLLEAIEAVIRRAPFFDEKEKDEEVQKLRDIMNGPPLDRPKEHMSQERAEYVRRLRIEEGYSLRALAATCSEQWGTNWGSNQISGVELCHTAAEILGTPPESFF
jgi:hypothetical protein